VRVRSCVCGRVCAVKADVRWWGVVGCRRSATSSRRGGRAGSWPTSSTRPSTTASSCGTRPSSSSSPGMGRAPLTSSARWTTSTPSSTPMGTHTRHDTTRACGTQGMTRHDTRRFICREIHQWDGEDQFHRHDPSSTGTRTLPSRTIHSSILGLTLRVSCAAVCAVVRVSPCVR
jgi:hypothetical protein